jgi:hypothetical protein
VAEQDHATELNQKLGHAQHEVDTLKAHLAAVTAERDQAKAQASGVQANSVSQVVAAHQEIDVLKKQLLEKDHALKVAHEHSMQQGQKLEALDLEKARLASKLDSATHQLSALQLKTADAPHAEGAKLSHRSHESYQPVD